MMVGVAIVALTLWALEVAKRRHTEFERRAQSATWNEGVCFRIAIEIPSNIDYLKGTRDQAASQSTKRFWESEIERFRRELIAEGRKAEYYKCLNLKYELAGRFPLLPVTPDPPLPNRSE
jgi:hypothetical protein